MELIDCVYLNAKVELTNEREGHIQTRHPDLLPKYRDQLIDTVADPDQVRLSRRSENARLFVKWFDNVKSGKYVIVVVVTEDRPVNHWIVSAYITLRLSPEDEVEWTKD